MDYIVGKGIFVGTFDTEDVANKKDIEAVAKMKKETGYRYTNIELIKKNEKIVLNPKFSFDHDK